MILKTSLLPYQVPAVKKLIVLKIGALYMEMGTGKTRTALELVKHRLETGKVNHVLWLCPCSVISDLRDELKNHCDGPFDWLTIEGIESLSSSSRLYANLLDLVANRNVFIIVDESNLVRNYFAIRTRRITKLAEFCTYRAILNGTPIGKCEADLFSQWCILDKRILGYNSFWSFQANHLEYDKYGNIRRVLNVDYLTEKIAPWTYIVKKTEVLPTLPGKNPTVERFSLTKAQEDEYFETKNWLLGNVDEFDSTTIYKLFTGLQQVVSGNRVVSIHPLTSIPMFTNPLDNPRIRKLMELLPNNRKTIIWCKFSKEIRDIKEVLDKEYGMGAAALFYGEISRKKRAEELNRFKKDAMFLLANKNCGGYGLNLQFCNNSIYYSNDFNWATRAHSEDRLHRIGQKERVDLTDILAYSKIDERILWSLQYKENLSESFKKALILHRDHLSEWIDGKNF